jgi:Zn-dependent metalloprotease
VKFFGQGLCLALLGAGLVAVPGIQATAAAPAPQPGKSLVQRMKSEAEGSVRLSAESATGKVGFIRVGREGDLMPSVESRSTVKAREYLDKYAAAFGAQSGELTQTEIRSDRYGTTVSYRQTHRGVPVFGALLRAHLDKQGDLTSVNGFAAPDLTLSVVPRLTAAQAGQRAVAAVKADPPGHNGAKASTAGLKAVSSDLMIYRTGATRGDAGSNVLVYVVEATNRANVRDMVFVDAASGKLVNRYSLVHDALERRVYEQSYAPESLVWKEGDPFPGNLNEDQQNIVNGSGEAYWFFRNVFGRDSYDGAGHVMETVNNDPRISCPNANWNGVTTNYCNGVTSDDVVAHEWGHAYTEKTHNLIYQWQPGALNESYSDIWGETIDLINGRMDADEGDITTKRPDGQCSKFTRGKIGMTINSPASVAGPCTAAAATFGPVFDAAGVTTDVVVGQDAANPEGPATTDGCTALSNGSAVAGNFVYVDRGTCTFQVKVDNAAAAGAEGIVVGDNVAGRAPISMSGNADIYGVMVTLEDGARIKSAGGPVNVTIKDVGTEPVANSYRWLMGEDSSAFGGAIRDMWTPTCYNDPGKVSDAQYFCDTDDGGGVHSNSGVPNHAYALTVDGGTYNGQTITGLGLTKAAAVYFRAMTEYQTPTTDFADHADALQASCTDLIGQPLRKLSTHENDSTVSTETIAEADCATFDAVAAAVELRKEPVQCNFKPLLDPNAPSLCGPGTRTNVVFSEDFEDGLAGWGRAQQVVNPGASGSPWVADSTLPGGRAGTGAYGPAPDQGTCDGSASDFSSRDSIISPMITLPTGKVVGQKLSFDHYVATEAGFDGGNVKYRVSNQQKWKVIPASAYTFNAPTTLASAAEGNTNPMAGEDGFTGTDGGEVFGSWGQSQVDLAALKLKGGKLQLRFDIGRDGCGGLDGWYVDDVRVTVCTATSSTAGIEEDAATRS